MPPPSTVAPGARPGPSERGSGGPAPTTVAALPLALSAVEVVGDDLREPRDQKWLVFIPLYPFARTTLATVRATDLEPELSRGLRPWFRGGAGDRAVRVRCVIAESWCEETRTLYGLSVAGVLLGGLLGPPLRFAEGRAAARFDVCDAAAPPAAPPLFSYRAEAASDVRAGVAGFVYWYDTAVTPRDLTAAAWAAAVADFVAALPPPASPVWRAQVK